VLSPFLRRLQAWVGLVAFATTFGLGVLTSGHLGLEDDAACGGLVGLGTKAPAVAAAVKSPLSPTHCPFCHWQRVVRNAGLPSVDAGISPLEPLTNVAPPASHPGTSATLDGRLSRGPPAYL